MAAYGTEGGGSSPPPPRFPKMSVNSGKQAKNSGMLIRQVNQDFKWKIFMQKGSCPPKKDSVPMPIIGLNSFGYDTADTGIGLFLFSTQG